MNPWFSIPSAPELEANIAEQVRNNLETDPDPPYSHPPKNMKTGQHLRFQILRRQFAKGGTFGLPAAVWSARKILTMWNRIRKAGNS